MGDPDHTGSLYELVLSRLAEAGSGRDSRAIASDRFRPRVRASASIVLWRRRPRLEVFWVRRSPRLAFMGGWHAFPGGTRSPADAAIEIGGSPRGADQGPGDAGMPATLLQGVDLEPLLAPGVVAAALRELFEETGVFPSAERALVAETGLAAARRALLAGEIDFPAALAELGAAPRADELVCAGRWLTPPLGPMRFDNRFFLLEWPRDRRIQPEVIPGELSEGEWVEPRLAIERWRAGEVIAAPPILYILEVLAQDGPDDGLRRLRDAREANLEGFRRVEFRPGVLLFPLESPTLPPATHTNAYLLGHENMVLVDPGSPYPAQIDALLGALRHLGREGRAVTAIWLTHHHRDHIGAVEAVRRELGVPVCAHRATARRLEPMGIAVDRSLEDGERVVLSGDPPMALRVLYTPGHARGHLAFLDETRGSLVAGDLVAGHGTIVIDPPEGNMSDYLASLERIRALGVSTLFPAHGPTIHDAGAFLERLIEHRLWREDKILAAWRSGARDTEALLDAVYSDVEPVALPLAARQLEAHLERLGSRGAI